MRFELRFRLCAALTLFASAFLAPFAGRAQQGTATDLEEKLIHAGIYFRADAPRVLRNPDDPNLPITLEIINGVEKTARTSGSSVSGVVRRPALRLLGVNVFISPARNKAEFVDEPLRLGESREFSFDARTGAEPLAVADRFRKTLEVPRAGIEDYLRGHYLGRSFDTVNVKVGFHVADWPSQNFYLRVRLNAPPLPHLPNWYRGDPHYHSAFTDNPAERGHPLDVSRQAALHAGFDWVVLADHSSDVTPERYAEELNEVQKYRDARFVFIRGEEVTVATGKVALLASTLHLVALPSPDDPDRGFPSPQPGADSVIMTGDGGVTSPGAPLPEVLERVRASGGFAYAAHPFDPISPLLRGGAWDVDVDFLDAAGRQLAPSLVGLEGWNRATMSTADNVWDPYCIQRDTDPALCFRPDPEANQYTRLERAIQLGWTPLLARGLPEATDTRTTPLFKVFLAAGSDAHGDFNYEATMDVVDFLSRPARAISGYAEDNAFGVLATVAYCPGGMGGRGECVLGALREGSSVATNGPLLVAGFDRNSNGSLDEPEDVRIGGVISAKLGAMPPLALAWASSSEFGPFESIRLVVGDKNSESKPVEIPVPAAKQLESGGLHPVDLRESLATLKGSWAYVRLEGRTRNSAGQEYRCYTNPIWIRVIGR